MGPRASPNGQFEYEMGVAGYQALLLIRQGTKDWSADGLPPNVWAQLFRQYGTNGRARSIATSCVAYVTMNTSKGVFSNANARKAVNSIGRRSFVQLDGARAGSTTSQLLTPPIPV